MMDIIGSVEDTTLHTLCPLHEGNVMMDIIGSVEDTTLQTFTKCEILFMIAITTGK
jgi:hypothetical protein